MCRVLVSSSNDGPAMMGRQERLGVVERDNSRTEHLIPTVIHYYVQIDPIPTESWF